jgi:hypothetical protein
MVLALGRLEALTKRARVALPLGSLGKRRRVEEKSGGGDFALQNDLANEKEEGEERG